MEVNIFPSMQSASIQQLSLYLSRLFHFLKQIIEILSLIHCHVYARIRQKARKNCHCLEPFLHIGEVRRELVIG